MVTGDSHLCCFDVTNPFASGYFQSPLVAGILHLPFPHRWLASEGGQPTTITIAAAKPIMNCTYYEQNWKGVG